jgi:subtilisin family serine protease
VLSSGSGLATAGNYNIYYAKETSPKGTVMFRFGCSKSDSSTVVGTWKITVKAEMETIVHAYIVDVSQSWAGTTRWKNSANITDESNVCFPSTADSCIAVGAYVVNFGWFDVVGDLASYSSKGYNITGKMGVDITAPGHSTFSAEKDNAWQIFSGTSSAAPHVVGTAALLLQYNPSLTHSQIRQIIINSAKRDNYTGVVPNPDWGYGKLDIEAAIRYLLNTTN